MRLPVLYRGEGEEWRRSCSGRRGWCSGPSSCPCWERRALNPGAGGEGGLQLRGRGREVREVEGRKGVLLIALGLTDDGVRAVPEVVLTGEEDLVSYWDLPVRLWRHNLTLVVADGLRPWRRPSPAPGSRSRGRPAWSTSNEAGG